ncbi:hypothetical protein EVAR_5823_1 [Eumeta japonica]|uniref:Uncharacterized protein n=1 Tax=Eumeta variegata TaxID=151549 RepID=A0A4C1T773_EUMVA|nr:hypothetical protein EVAR_5823_1 [Eumeta japonica]
MFAHTVNVSLVSFFPSDVSLTSRCHAVAIPHVLSRDKRACQTPENRWPTPPMDLRDLRVTSALPAFWEGMRYLMEEECGNGEWRL